MSNLKEKYINPLTDFGFKKLFGTEPNKIFTKLFEAAEIAKFTPKEREAYEESLKYYRDIKNVVDTSREEGVEEGLKEGLKEGIEKGIEKGKSKRNLEIAKRMKAEGLPDKQIKKITGLSEEEITKL